MKKALMVATIGNFLAGFEINDMYLLQELGYEVHCAANMTVLRPERQKRIESAGIISHHLPISRSPFSRDNIKAYHQLIELIKSERFELVHCHTPVGGVLGRIAAHKCRVPKVLYTAHGFHFYKGAPLANWVVYYPIEKWMSRYSDFLITINTEDYILASNRFHAKKTVYVPGIGVDTKRFTNASGESIRQEFGISGYMLLSVGELNKNKNHEAVIHAISGLDVTYVVVGSGELGEHLQQVANDNQVKLILPGYRVDVANFYAAADAYILPSIREGLNVSLMEAMASGLPCLCGRIRGNTDLIDSEGGLLFDPNNVNDIRKAVKKIKCNDSGMGSHNKQKVKAFDVNIVRSLMFDFYGS